MILSFLRPAATNFWSGNGGALQILQVALPLTLSASSNTIMNFMDRKFLFSYSSDAFAAAAPSGMVSFVVLSLFMGTAGYVNTFVAQYVGAGKPWRVGSALWQGIYFSLLSWVVMAPLALLANPFFDLVGHGPSIARMEATYFAILTLGSGFALLNVALSNFFTGRGRTWSVMWVRFVSMAINIPLNYCMIFGHWGFPEMGIAGAAIATVVASAFGTVLLAILIFTPKNNRDYGVIRCWRPDGELFFRLLRFGFPSGIQFMVDMIGFTFFLLMVGRLGPVELQATNAAFTMNGIVFIPMIGFSIAISAIVGQEVGRRRIWVARLATRNSVIMVACYMGTISVLFVLVPRFFLGVLLGEGGGSGPEYAAVEALAVVLMRFVAFYSFFDAFALVYSSSIKGAGDTRFVMWATLAVSLGLLVIPSYLCVAWGLPATVAWAFAAAYVIVMAVVFHQRYRAGHWQRMRVIEPSHELELAPIEAPRMDV